MPAKIIVGWGPVNRALDCSDGGGKEESKSEAAAQMENVNGCRRI